MKRDYKKDEAVIKLKETFVKVFLKYTTTANVDKFWKQVLRIYTGKNRHYHNIDHIFRMVGLWEVNYNLFRNPDAIFVAIIYHDIVYDTTGKDSEGKSTRFFINKVQPHLNIDFNEPGVVIRAIFASRHTEESKTFLTVDGSDQDIQLFLDFDLEILSTRHTSEYEWYRLGVRKEYSFVPLKKYKEGRKAVLESFLKRKEIYLTQTFKINEKKARKNLRNEINLYLCENKNK